MKKGELFMGHIIYYNQLFSNYSEPVSEERDALMRETIIRICNQMEINKSRFPYNACVGWSSDLSDPFIRNALKESLNIIWHYCLDNELPWLNTLVVSSKSSLPSDNGWFRNRFTCDDLNAYNEYFKKQVELAEFAVQNGLIVFDGTVFE